MLVAAIARRSRRPCRSRALRGGGGGAVRGLGETRLVPGRGALVEHALRGGLVEGARGLVDGRGGGLGVAASRRPWSPSSVAVLSDVRTAWLRLGAASRSDWFRLIWDLMLAMRRSSATSGLRHVPNAQPRPAPVPIGARDRDISHIRNFCIVAHIDHGKSTLADRLLELTHTVDGPRHARAVPRQDGPGARARDHDQGAGRPPRYRFEGVDHELNLIDTPGHVDFTYEVSRSLAACEGAVLLVDAAQGSRPRRSRTSTSRADAGPGHRARAQQDRPAGRPSPTRRAERARRGRRTATPRTSCASSAPSRGGRDRADRGDRRARSRRPTGDATQPLRALIFDSIVRPVPRRHRVRPGEATARCPRARRSGSMATRVESEAEEAGVMAPEATPCRRARGRARSATSSPVSKDVHQVEGRRHDHARRQAGARASRSRATASRSRWCGRGLFPAEGGDYSELREALDRLKLYDAALQLRARDVDGARVRVPVRVPRAAPHGHREGAARARVRPRADRDGAQRRVPT